MFLYGVKDGVKAPYNSSEGLGEAHKRCAVDGHQNTFMGHRCRRSKKKTAKIPTHSGSERYHCLGCSNRFQTIDKLKIHTSFFHSASILNEVKIDTAISKSDERWSDELDSIFPRVETPEPSCTNLSVRNSPKSSDNSGGGIQPVAGELPEAESYELQATAGQHSKKIFGRTFSSSALGSGETYVELDDELLDDELLDDELLDDELLDDELLDDELLDDELLDDELLDDELLDDELLDDELLVESQGEPAKEECILSSSRNVVKDKLHFMSSSKDQQKKTSYLPETFKNDCQSEPIIYCVDLSEIINESDIIKEYADSFNINFENIDGHLEKIPFVLPQLPEESPEESIEYYPATPFPQEHLYFEKRNRPLQHHMMMFPEYDRPHLDGYWSQIADSYDYSDQRFNLPVDSYFGPVGNRVMSPEVGRSMMPGTRKRLRAPSGKSKRKSKKSRKQILLTHQAEIIKALNKGPRHFGYDKDKWKPEHVSSVLKEHFRLEYKPCTIQNFFLPKYFGMTLGELNRNIRYRQTEPCKICSFSKSAGNTIK